MYYTLFCCDCFVLRGFKFCNPWISFPCISVILVYSKNHLCNSSWFSPHSPYSFLSPVSLNFIFNCIVLVFSYFTSLLISLVFYFLLSLFVSFLKNVLFYYFRVYKYSAQRIQRRALIPRTHNYLWLLAALCVGCEMNLHPLEEYTPKYWPMHGPGVSLPWKQKESWLMNKNGLFIKFLFETFLLYLIVSTTMSLQRITTFNQFAKPSDQCYTELFYSWACPLLASSHLVPIV